ncbi:hypothetical protein [uncultured Mitsuokella sp.]|uniref:hypothetical protein n=1 Tax=uncultured Mitsuokella sp. TaxID=453120 RepID=UPI002597D4B5|nr:hypothetical protein [uncultured Mitsuokella sp.]
MSSIDVSIVNNVVAVMIDNRYSGFSDIPKELNGCDESVFIEAVSDSIKAAVTDAKEKMRPKNGETYYVPHPFSKSMYSSQEWAGDSIDRRVEERGLMFKTKEEAIEAAKKMLEVVK